MVGMMSLPLIVVMEEVVMMEPVPRVMVIV
jgi:hypothetical protein